MKQSKRIFVPSIFATVAVALLLTLALLAVGTTTTQISEHLSERHVGSNDAGSVSSVSASSLNGQIAQQAPQPSTKQLALEKERSSAPLRLSIAPSPSMLSQAGTPLTDTFPTHGPGIPQVTFPAGELFQVVSRINADNGAPRSHGSVSMHNGYLVVIFAIGGGRHVGGFAFYDLSDPYNPKFITSKDDESTDEIREAHGYGYTSTMEGPFKGRDLVALQARRGVQIWDWTDVYTPTQVSYLTLDDISGGDYTNANWWTFWQAPYIYIAGADSGIYIIDASDPTAPQLINRIPNTETGGFRVGSLYAIGNLLVIAGNDVPGYATLDISNPGNPKLLDSTIQGPENYSVLVNGNRIFGAARFKELYAHDISDPRNIQQVGYFKGTNDKGGYLSYQDGYIHMGASVNYVKVDVRDESNYTLVDTATSGIADRDEDFATVLGNFVILGDDHENGSFIIPHQAEPDTKGPEVNMVSPSIGALNQLTTTRVGLTFSDLVDLRTVNTTTVQIRRIDSPTSSVVLSGTYSGQTAIVNFTPAVPLKPDSVYEVFVPGQASASRALLAGSTELAAAQTQAVADVTGNPAASDFRSYFSTGSAFSIPPSCELAQPEPTEVGEIIEFKATTLSGVGVVTYTWDFGDESVAPPPSNSGIISYTYAEAGHYSVRAEIQNTDGTDTCVAQATIHYPLVDTPAQQSSTIIVSQDGSSILNANPDNDTVTSLAAEGYAKRWESSVGENPRTLAQAPDGTIWVVNQLGASITILNQSDGATVGTIDLPFGSQPYGIVIDSDSGSNDGLAYVSLQASGKLLKLDVTSRTITGELPIGPSPRGLALNGEGKRLFIGRFISPRNHGEITEVDTTSFSVVRTIQLAFDPGPDTESSGRGVPNGLGQIGASPDGLRLWVPAKKDNTARGKFASGETHGFDSTVRTIAAQVNLESNQEDPAERHDFENSDQASAVAFTALGDYVFVALQGSNAVAVVDTYSGQMITQLPQSGIGPVGLALNADSTRLFVHSFLSRSVLVYNVPDLLAGNPNARQPLVEIATVAEEKLTDVVLQGKRIFYNAQDARMNQDGYISCASCHMDGGHDGQVWDRGAHGEGMRNTISLIGRGGMAHGRIHWSSNFDEIQDFEHDMRTQFGGLGFLPDEAFHAENRSHPLGAPKAGIDPELDALAAYVASLNQAPDSPHRNGDGALTSQAVNGRQIFDALNCGRCHGGPNFTDSSLGLLHDVGTMQSASGNRLNMTLIGLDTPTLIGLWESAPYGHNGQYATLSELLLATPVDSLHGEAAQLSGNDRSDLIAYLQQIDGLEAGPQLPEPVIQISQPQSGERYSTNEMLTIAVDVVQPLRSVVRVDFFVNGVLIGSDSLPPYSVEWQTPSEGENTLSFLAAKVVYDDNSGSAHEVIITVDAAEPTRIPTATPLPAATPIATPDPVPSPIGNISNAPVWEPLASSSIRVEGPVSFTIQSSDPDGDALVLTALSLPEGASFVDNGNGSGTFQWAPTAADFGTHPVTIRATDANGVTTDISIPVVVVIGATDHQYLPFTTR